MLMAISNLNPCPREEYLFPPKLYCSPTHRHSCFAPASRQLFRETPTATTPGPRSRSSLPCHRTPKSRDTLPCRPISY